MDRQDHQERSERLARPISYRVTHIYDGKAVGEIVGEDPKDSRIIYVRWADSLNAVPCLRDELHAIG